MDFKCFKFFFVITLLMFFLTPVVPNVKKEDEKKDVTCIVRGHVNKAGGYESSGTLYLVLEEETTGKRFSLSVAPQTFVYEKGTILIFSLSERQMTNRAGALEKHLSHCGLMLAITIVFLILPIAIDYREEKCEK